MVSTTLTGKGTIVHYIDVNNLYEDTGLEPCDIDDASASYHDRIEKAIIEFERDCERTFSGSESDYTIAQRAVSFRTAYDIHLSRREPEYARIMWMEYARLLRILRKIPAVGDTPSKMYFSPTMHVITQENLDD